METTGMLREDIIRNFENLFSMSTLLMDQCVLLYYNSQTGDITLHGTRHRQAIKQILADPQNFQSHFLKFFYDKQRGEEVNGSQMQAQIEIKQESSDNSSNNNNSPCLAKVKTEPGINVDSCVPVRVFQNCFGNDSTEGINGTDEILEVKKEKLEDREMETSTTSTIRNSSSECMDVSVDQCVRTDSVSTFDQGTSENVDFTVNQSDCKNSVLTANQSSDENSALTVNQASGQNSMLTYKESVVDSFARNVIQDVSENSVPTYSKNETGSSALTFTQSVCENSEVTVTSTDNNIFTENDTSAEVGSSCIEPTNMKEESYMLSGDERIRSCPVFRTLKRTNVQDEMSERKFSRNVDKSEDFQDSGKKLEDYYTENIQVTQSNESAYRQSFAHTGKAGKEKDETCPLLLTCSTEMEVEVCEQTKSGSLEFTKNTDQTKNTEQNKTVISLEHSYCHDCDINEDPQRPVSLANQSMIGKDKSEKKMVSILPRSINVIKAEKQRFSKTNTEDSYEILEYQKSEKHVVLRMNKRKHLSYPKEFTIKIPDQSDIANAKVRRMEGNTPNLLKEEAYQEKEQFDSTNVSEKSKADANKDAGTRKKIVLPLCLVCHDAFTSVESLQEHVEVRKHQQICQGQTDFQCHICHKFLRSEWDLKFHRRLKHTEKKNKKLKEHHAGQMEVHNIGILCNQCDKQFRSEDSLHAHIQKSKHEQVSIKVTEFKCISCNTYFVDNWNLEFHMIATGHLPGSLPSSEGIQFIMQKWLTCPECDSKYSSLKELNKHIKVNQHKENYGISYLDLKCSQCDIFFANSAELYDHVIGFGHQIHVCLEGSGSSHRTYSEGKKVFSTLCYYCNRIFESVDDCNAHLMWHDHEETCLNETHYKCYTCRRYFLRHADIMCHMKRTQHSGSWVSQERKMFELKSKSKNKTFCCTSCHTLFDTMAGIRDHIETAHFCGDETVKCPCCTQTFTNINLQQIHLAEVHEGEYPFKCQECGLVFFNKGNFTKHTMRHTYESRASSSLNQAIMLKERCSPDGSDELKRLGLFINNIQKRMEIMKIQRSLHPCGPADENGIIRDQLEEEQTCIQCSETFSSYYELRMHVMGSGHEQVVDEDSPYMCFTCSRRFIKFADLELHMDLTHHSGNESTTRDRLGNMIGQFPKLLHLKGTGKSNRRYKCSRCLRIFTRKGLIDQHIRENACYVKWSKNCPCCLVKYDSRNIYAAHLHQVHFCEYPFVCKEQDCKKLFYSFQAFMWHAGSHGIHEETRRTENMTNHLNLRFTSTEENGTQGDGIATCKSEVDNTSYPASSMDIEESELADPCLGRSQEKLENKLEAKVNYCHDETKEKCTSDSDDDREGFYNTTEPKRINSMFVCKFCLQDTWYTVKGLSFHYEKYHSISEQTILDCMEKYPNIYDFERNLIKILKKETAALLRRQSVFCD